MHRTCALQRWNALSLDYRDRGPLTARWYSHRKTSWICFLIIREGRCAQRSYTRVLWNIPTLCKDSRLLFIQRIQRPEETERRELGSVITYRHRDNEDRDWTRDKFFYCQFSLFILTVVIDAWLMNLDLRVQALRDGQRVIYSGALRLQHDVISTWIQCLFWALFRCKSCWFQVASLSCLLANHYSCRLRTYWLENPLCPTDTTCFCRYVWAWPSLTLLVATPVIVCMNKCFHWQIYHYIFSTPPLSFYSNTWVLGSLTNCMPNHPPGHWALQHALISSYSCSHHSGVFSPSVRRLSSAKFWLS